MENNEIQKRRHEIDRIDGEILDLINKRTTKSLEIGQLKKKGELPVYDPSREREIIDALCSINDGPLPASSLRHIFSEIMSASRALQVSTRVAFLGPEHTFSHMAALEHFSISCEFSPQATITEVFQEVESGHAQYGVVPVENSTEGSVNITLDLMLDSDLLIVGETYVKIDQTLMCREGDLDRIERIFSHPQALNQCRLWLQRNLPARPLIETSSTAEAARRAREENGAAAIGSELAARHYGLAVVARKIQNYTSNITRFFLIGKEAHERTGKDKTSIIFTTVHQPGALYKALKPLADSGINLTRIESRPAGGKPWEYSFFVDFQGHSSDPDVTNALDGMKKSMEFLKVLGSYPRGNEGEEEENQESIQIHKHPS
jgi:chorismate mutase/prephenate dehydratase